MLSAQFLFIIQDCKLAQETIHELKALILRRQVQAID